MYDKPEALNPKDIQNLRIMLMMYRQGYLDAARHLQSQSMVIAAQFKREYDQLVKEYPLTTE